MSDASRHAARMCERASPASKRVQPHLRLALGVVA